MIINQKIVFSSFRFRIIINMMESRWKRLNKQTRKTMETFSFFSFFFFGWETEESIQCLHWDHCETVAIGEAKDDKNECNNMLLFGSMDIQQQSFLSINLNIILIEALLIIIFLCAVEFGNLVLLNESFIYDWNSLIKTLTSFGEMNF